MTKLGKSVRHPVNDWMMPSNVPRIAKQTLTNASLAILAYLFQLLLPICKDMLFAFYILSNDPACIFPSVVS